MQLDHLNRRDFIKTAGLGALAYAALPGIVWSWDEVPSRTGKIITGRKLNIACIGVGGKGRSDVNEVASENIVALCDVDDERAKKSFARFPDAKRYKDFRVMLMEMDDQIDAVTISTPDHMHFAAAMMAIKMGKHVFVQKPLTHTIAEARALTEAARKHKVMTQMGIQGHSFEGIRRMREWYQARAIGEIKEIHVWTNRPVWQQGKRPLPQAQEIPANLDWNLWQGVASERDYNQAYAPFAWRGWAEYGCGALGDIGCHALDCPFDVLELKNPSSVEAITGPQSEWSFPEWSIVTYQFSATTERGAIKLVWYDGKKLPERPKELEAARKLPSGDGGQLWYGTEGTIMISDIYCKSARLIPQSAWIDFAENRMPKQTEQPSIGHMQEWIEACKGGEPAQANFDYSGPLTEMVLLGNLAVRSGKKIEWDSENMRCTNVAEANKLVRKKYRKY
ncbi:MAG TPA: oxidoreductase [Rhodobacteraceae bacterium]|nr:oxidoreductase [Paracoccaceae bacterium]